jgi:hypothetical protein
MIALKYGHASTIGGSPPLIGACLVIAGVDPAIFLREGHGPRVNLTCEMTAIRFDFAMRARYQPRMVRENTESLYADRAKHQGPGEFMPTPNVAVAVHKATRRTPSALSSLRALQRAAVARSRSFTRPIAALVGRFVLRLPPARGDATCRHRLRGAPSAAIALPGSFRPLAGV